ncbi:unnamed protein product [Urochloa humidicola]
MDCCFRVYGLAIANTVCVGGTAFLVFALVKLARTPHSAGGIVVVSIFLIFWLGVNASVYPAFRAGPVPRAARQRRPLAALPPVEVRARRADAAPLPEERRRCQRQWLAAVRDAKSWVHHQRASTGAAGARRSGAGGWRRRRNPGVRAARRRRVTGLCCVPRKSGEGGDGEEAAGVPAHVPPGVH